MVEYLMVEYLIVEYLIFRYLIVDLEEVMLVHKLIASLS